MVDQQVKTFFSDIFDKGRTNFRCFIHKTSNKRDAHGYITNDNTYTTLKLANEENYEIYFVPNSGGYKDAEISGINAVFADFDCGKDENGQYFPMKNVRKYKDEKLIELHRFKHLPSYIIETRNGLQVYWLLNEAASIDQFKECESRLIAYFNADKKVKSPANLMRVPGFYWSKNPSDKFLANIIERNEVRYDISILLNSLPPTHEKEGISDSKSLVSNKEIIGVRKPSTTSNSEDIDYLNINLIKQRDKYLSRVINYNQPVEGEIVSNRKEVYDKLKRKNLHEFLGIHRTHFNCIFHNDPSPSASIYQDPKTGYWWYKCWSDKCGFTGTIIQVAEKLTGLTNYKSLKYLTQTYQIKLEKTEWQQEQEELLRQNLDWLNDDEMIKVAFPNLYKIMRLEGCYALLREFHDIAIENLSSISQMEGQENAVIYASFDYVMERLNKYYHFDKFKKSNKKRSQAKIHIFIYLKLLQRIGLNELPEVFAERAKKEASKKKQKNTISFYSIPSYDANSMGVSEQLAKQFFELYMNIENFDREMMVRLLGEEEADRVFPERKGEKLPVINESTVHAIEKTALKIINEKGWATKTEIIEKTKLNINVSEVMKKNKTSVKKNEEDVVFSVEEQKKWEYDFKERIFNKIQGNLIHTYDLQKIRLNTTLKANLHITNELPPDSFPHVIIKKDALPSSQDEKVEN